MFKWLRMTVSQPSKPEKQINPDAPCYKGYTRNDRERMMDYWKINLLELEQLRDPELDIFFR